jgi:hypothetical protein
LSKSTKANISINITNPNRPSASTSTSASLFAVLQQRLDLHNSVLVHLLTVATGDEFLAVLPPVADLTFHLPFMERAFQHSAPTSHLKQCVHQQAMALTL